jgi:hypothetical protein
VGGSALGSLRLVYVAHHTHIHVFFHTTPAALRQNIDRLAMTSKSGRLKCLLCTRDIRGASYKTSQCFGVGRAHFSCVGKHVRRVQAAAASSITASTASSTASTASSSAAVSSSAITDSSTDARIRDLEAQLHGEAQRYAQAEALARELDVRVHELETQLVVEAQRREQEEMRTRDLIRRLDQIGARVRNFESHAHIAANALVQTHAKLQASETRASELETRWQMADELRAEAEMQLDREVEQRERVETDLRVEESLCEEADARARAVEQQLADLRASVQALCAALPQSSLVQDLTVSYQRGAPRKAFDALAKRSQNARIQQFRSAFDALSRIADVPLDRILPSQQVEPAAIVHLTTAERKRMRTVDGTELPSEKRLKTCVLDQPKPPKRITLRCPVAKSPCTLRS